MGQYVGVGVESSFGGGASTHIYLYVKSFNVDSDRSAKQTGIIDNFVSDNVHPELLKISGSCEFTFRPSQLDNILYGLLGIRTIVSGNRVYTTGRQPSLEFLTLLGHITPYISSIRGVVITDGKLTIESSGLAKLSINFIARDIRETTKRVPSYVSEEPVPFYDLVLKITHGSAVTRYDVKSFELQFAKNVNTNSYVIDSPLLHCVDYTGIPITTGKITFIESVLDDIRSALYGDYSRTQYVDGVLSEVDITLENLTSVTSDWSIQLTTVFVKALMGSQEMTHNRTIEFVTKGSPTISVAGA